MRENAKTATARELRRNETMAERWLWQQLRNRQLDGFKFVRQAPAGPFIADFLCRENRLIVEVDGATHSSDAEMAKDWNRSAHLNNLGYSVVRFQNDDILNGMDEVLTLIREDPSSLRANSPSPSPLLRNGFPSSPASRRG